jgi:hypothetical protein
MLLTSSAFPGSPPQPPWRIFAMMFRSGVLRYTECA